MNTIELRKLMAKLASEKPRVAEAIKKTKHWDPVPMDEMIANMSKSPDLRKIQPEEIVKAAARELREDKTALNPRRSEIKDLIDRATKDNFYDKVDLSVGMGKDLLDKEDIIRKASLYGTKLGDTERMLKYANRVGNTDKMAQAGEAYIATRLAQALGDDDIKFIVDHADVLNQQGKDALIQLLLERKDTVNLHGLNKKLDNEFINKDLKNKFTRDQAKLLDEAVANNELQQKFYSKLDDDETAAELTGMSVDPRTDPARSRLIADRMRNGQTVDTSVDEMFNADITDKQLAEHPRYKKWIAEEERRLRGKVPSSPVRKEYIDPDFASKKRSLKGAVRASDIKDDTEILEQAINNRYGSVDNLRNILKDVPEGAEGLYDEAADLLNRYDNAMDKASNSILRDELGDIDEDNVMNQFIDPRYQEWIKSTPRPIDYGEQSLMLRDNERADRFFRAREAKGMKKERDLPTRTVNRVRGIKQTPDERRKELIELASKSKDKNVPVYRGGEKPAYFMTEKEVLRDMYPRHTRIEYEKIPTKYKERVVDTHGSLDHPSKPKVENPKQTQLDKLMDDVKKLPEGKSVEEFDARVTKDGGKYWVELEDDMLPGEWDLHNTAFDTPDEVYRFLVKESFLGMNHQNMRR